MTLIESTLSLRRQHLSMQQQGGHHLHTQQAQKFHDFMQHVPLKQHLQQQMTKHRMIKNMTEGIPIKAMYQKTFDSPMNGFSHHGYSEPIIYALIVKLAGTSLPVLLNTMTKSSFVDKTRGAPLTKFKSFSIIDPVEFERLVPMYTNISPPSISSIQKVRLLLVGCQISLSGLMIQKQVSSNYLPSVTVLLLVSMERLTISSSISKY